jgi:large subunit ribosomal protein L28
MPVFGKKKALYYIFSRKKEEVVFMARKCQVTGIKSLKGMQRSHALNSQIKFQHPNLHKKKFWVPGENRWVTLKVSSKGMRTINKKGIKAVLRKIDSA